MGKVLMFGGLSRLGKPIIEQLLNNGVEVMAVRTLGRNQSQEEDIEMVFGRHAFFQSLDNEWLETSQEVEAVICLDGTTFSPDDIYVDSETMSWRITKCLEICPNLQDIMVLSHIDVYGKQAGEINERTPVAPDTDKGRQADEVERGVIETLLRNKEKARTIRLTICRLPNLSTDNHINHNESVLIDDVAEGIYKLLRTTREPGIEVVQLTSGKEVVTEHGLAKYSFDKARHLINFTPKQDE